MRMTCVVLTMLAVSFVVVGSSDAADDAAAKEKPAKGRWVQAMEKTFKTKDKDKDGFLSFDEFKGKAKKPEAIERAEQIFKLIDADKDLKVSLKEFTNKPPEARLTLCKCCQPRILCWTEYCRVAPASGI